MPGIAPKQTRAARGRSAGRGPSSGAAAPRRAPGRPARCRSADAARSGAAGRSRAASNRRDADQPPALPPARGPPTRVAGARLRRRERGPRRRNRPDAGRGEHEQRHHDARRRRRAAASSAGCSRTAAAVSPTAPRTRSSGERDEQLRQRELGTAAPARLLPEPADHRPALPAGQPGQQVDRDPPRAALRRCPATRSTLCDPDDDVLTANADHGCSPFTQVNPHTYTKKTHRLPPSPY